MGDLLVINFVTGGLLTVTVDGNMYSVPIAPNATAIQVYWHGGRHGFYLNKLPLRYPTSLLIGGLSILDGAARMLYCWPPDLALNTRMSHTSTTTPPNKGNLTYDPQGMCYPYAAPVSSL